MNKHITTPLAARLPSVNCAPSLFSWCVETPSHRDRLRRPAWMKFTTPLDSPLLRPNGLDHLEAAFPLPVHVAGKSQLLGDRATAWGYSSWNLKQMRPSINPARTETLWRRTLRNRWWVVSINQINLSIKVCAAHTNEPMLSYPLGLRCCSVSTCILQSSIF
jgi:hypothetical protein